MRLLIALLYSTLALAGSDVDKQGIVNQNLLDPWNGGFENGKAGWTIGTDTISVDSSTPLTGKASLTWDSAGASRILASKAVTIPRGLYGRNGMAQCKVVVASGTATHTVSVYDGTNTLVTGNIISSTNPAYTPLNFVFPSSGTVQIRITSVAADEPSIEIDDCYIGEAANLTNVSQAELYGTLQFAAAASCSWAGTNSTSYNNYSTDSDCATPTVTGYATTTLGKIPGVNFASLPPGNYRVVAQFTMDPSTADLDCSYRLSDGTTSGPANSSYPAASGGNGETARTLEANFSYTTAQGSTSFQIQSATAVGSGTCNVYTQRSGQVTYFAVYRYPIASQIAYNADQVIDPVGTVITVAGTTCPSNTLVADGTAVSRSTYAQLFSKMGIIHGQGDGSTTFNLPDYRGRFLRGQDSGTGRDEDAASRTAMNTGGQAGDNVGSVQTDAFQGHYHSMTNNTGYLRSGAGSYQILNASTATLNDSPSVTAPTTDGTNGTPRTAKETRPDNANVRYCVVYGGGANVPILLAHSDLKPLSWSGYHAQSDCSWARTNSVFADPTADASCTFTEQTNQNFGTVTSADSGGSKLPGITFTPQRVGRYNVCATFPQSTSDAGVGVGASLTDGTTAFVQQAWDAQAAGGYQFPVVLCGIYNATDTSAKTLKIQIRAGAGTTTISAPSYLTAAVRWSIFALDQSFPMPYYGGTITNSGGNQVRVEAAELNCDAGSSITRQMNSSSWVSSIGNISSGGCAVTLTSGVFSSTPHCTVSLLNTGAGTGEIVWATPSSSTSVSVLGVTSASANSSGHNVTLNCVGPR
jgi:microcystin-dependent protein